MHGDDLVELIEKTYPVCNKKVRAIIDKQMATDWYEHDTMSQRHQDYLKLKKGIV